MKNLSSLLEKFKTIRNVPPNTLFDIEPEWSLLKELRCPVCKTKLSFPLKRSIALCRGKRHGDKRPFKIKLATLAKYGYIKPPEKFSTDKVKES